MYGSINGTGGLALWNIEPFATHVILGAIRGLRYRVGTPTLFFGLFARPSALINVYGVGERGIVGYAFAYIAR